MGTAGMMRRGIAGALALGLVTPVVTTEAKAGAEPIRLGRGETAFWTGPMVARSGLASHGEVPGLGVVGHHRCPPSVAEAAPASVRCITFEIEVKQPPGREKAGDWTRLRVALDHPSYYDGFGLALVDPSGDVVDHDSGEISVAPNTDAGGPFWNFNAEVYAVRPRAGVWQATAIANDVVDSAFRMRAKLEDTEPARTSELLLPNLQPTPPFLVEFAPCTASEQDSWGATRCLRFAQGPMNAGRGALELFFTDTGLPREGPDGHVTLRGTQYQRIYRADGTFVERPAGEFEFHPEHGHYHHSQTGQYELYRVVDPTTGALEHAGSGPKHGFCMGDFAIVDWEGFDNAPRRRELDYFGRPSCLSPVANQMSISAGWGDVYASTVDGTAVDFGDNPPGLYVVRATVNPGRDLHEERYDDNLAYTLITVCEGDTVIVHRRGIGADPWHEVRVVDDARQPVRSAPKTEPPGTGPTHC